MEYIKYVWDGKEKLVKTYWIFYASGVLAFLIAAHAIAFIIGPISKNAFMVFFSIQTLYVFFCVGAVWRSAGNYEGSAWWKYLARANMVIAVLAMMGEWAKLLET